MERTPRITKAWAMRAVTNALKAYGIQDRYDTEISIHDIADVLIETSVLGVQTHGLRLLPLYLDELERKIAKPKPNLQTLKTTASTLYFDADQALGIYSGLYAVQQAKRIAENSGIAIVGASNSNHFGAAGYYTRLLASSGLIGIATTSAASRVAPYSGKNPLLGTNPISIAYGDEFCLDMATSQVCFSEIKERALQKIDLQSGWAVTESGNSAINPKDAFALLPLGGYKGQGLAMAVTLLTSTLLGGHLDWEMQHLGKSDNGKGRGVSHLFIAIDPDLFAGKQQVASVWDSVITKFRQASPTHADQPVVIPGDPQAAFKHENDQLGIDIDQATYQVLRSFV
jgi:ureidoglycolate dehydrogenase (NAD+)